MKNRPILLSIDLDFFAFEDPWWDWGHSESMRQEWLWAIRLFSTTMSGVDLIHETRLERADFHPLKVRRVLEEAGWKVNRRCQLTVSDSHAYAFHAFNSFTNARIVNIDAHHDLGYGSLGSMRKRWKSKQLQCEDWLWFYLRKHVHADAVVVYPTWKPGGDWPEAPHWKGTSVSRRTRQVTYSPEVMQELAGEVVAIHIARSGAWFPPWHDAVMPAMLLDISSRLSLLPQVIGDDDPLKPREFTLDAIRNQAVIARGLYRQL